MRVVITGASGFLGRAVIRRLIYENIEHIGVSRYAHKGLMQVSHYSNTPDADILIHLAETNDRGLVNRLGDDYKLGTLETLDSLLEKKYQKVIYISSAVVYGDSKSEPRKACDPVYNTDTYTAVKLSSEKQILTRSGVVARMSNLYGPGMASSNVLSTIMRQLNQNSPLYLQNTSPIRDFLWVDDAASAIVKMVQSDKSGLFNVGTGVGTSIYQLASIALEANCEPEREIISKHDNISSCIITDISETTLEYNWLPKVSVQEGVNQLINLDL